MRNWFRSSMTAMAAAGVVVAVFSQTGKPAAGQAGSRPPRTADGKPNLNGIWEALGTAHWDLQDHAAMAGPIVALGAIGAVPAGQGVVEGREIPYKPAALAKKKENFEKRLTLDPEV